MSYAPYPAYKDSGVSWLGNIPEHWDWAKLYLLSKRYAGGTPDKNVPEYWENGTIPWLNSGSVNQFNIDTPSAFITEEAYKNSSAKWVPEGALLMALAGQGKTKGMVAQTTFDTTCNQSMAAIVWKKANPRFMLWWLNSQYLNIRGLASSDARDGLNLEMLARIPCPLPSEDEQTAIAYFLDKKTAEIDDLIAKKEELLRLLAEQRTALITRAVTKGLNPNAPMKPSGIDWLGDVPQGWDVVRLRHLLADPLKYGANESAEFEVRSDPRYIRITDVREDGTLRDETFRSLPEQVAAPYLLEDGDILLARSGATVGKTFIYKPSWGRAAFAGYLIRARVNKRVIPDFLYAYLQSKAYWSWLGAAFIQATIQNVSAEKYADLPVPVPPCEEQQDIVDKIATETASLDNVSKEVQRAVSHLREYRSALITNAVTGKIKVA